jgi:hypothetical protein
MIFLTDRINFVSPPFLANSVRGIGAHFIATKKQYRTSQLWEGLMKYIAEKCVAVKI